MNILNALKTLYNKITSKNASGGSIGAVVQELADNWPESSGSTVVIDNTLSKTGQAADAKATGDALNGKAPTSHTHTASPGQRHDGQGRACQAGSGRGGCRWRIPHEGRI